MLKSGEDNALVCFEQGETVNRRELEAVVRMFGRMLSVVMPDSDMVIGDELPVGGLTGTQALGLLGCRFNRALMNGWVRDAVKKFKCSEELPAEEVSEAARGALDRMQPTLDRVWVEVKSVDLRLCGKTLPRLTVGELVGMAEAAWEVAKSVSQLYMVLEFGGLIYGGATKHMRASLWQDIVKVKNGPADGEESAVACVARDLAWLVRCAMAQQWAMREIEGQGAIGWHKGLGFDSRKGSVKVENVSTGASMRNVSPGVLAFTAPLRHKRSVLVGLPPNDANAKPNYEAKCGPAAERALDGLLRGLVSTQPRSLGHGLAQLIAWFKFLSATVARVIKTDTRQYGSNNEAQNYCTSVAQYLFRNTKVSAKLTADIVAGDAGIVLRSGVPMLADAALAGLVAWWIREQLEDALKEEEPEEEPKARQDGDGQCGGSEEEGGEPVEGESGEGGAGSGGAAGDESEAGEGSGECEGSSGGGGGGESEGKSEGESEGEAANSGGGEEQGENRGEKGSGEGEGEGEGEEEGEEEGEGVGEGRGAEDEEGAGDAAASVLEEFEKGEEDKEQAVMGGKGDGKGNGAGYAEPEVMPEFLKGERAAKSFVREWASDIEANVRLLLQGPAKMPVLPSNRGSVVVEPARIVTDGRFLRTRVVTDDVWAHVVLLLDVSGSMFDYGVATPGGECSCIEVMAKMLKEFERAASRLRMPVDCVAFADRSASVHVSELPTHTQQALADFFKGLGFGTQMGSGLIKAKQLFEKSRAARKVLLVFSDGDTCDTSVSGQMSRELKEMGVRLVGCSLGGYDRKRLKSSLAGAPTFSVLDDEGARKLRVQMRKAFTKALLMKVE